MRDPKTNEVDVRQISEIGEFEGEKLERVNPIEPLEVNVGDGWSEIQKVIRHPFSGKLKKITTKGGTIHVTDNHSIYKWGTGRGSSLVRSGELKTGQYLQMPRLGWIERKGDSELYFLGGEKLAWLYGFFVAEGVVEKNGRGISISNTDLSL